MSKVESEKRKVDEKTNEKEEIRKSSRKEETTNVNVETEKEDKGKKNEELVDFLSAINKNSCDLYKIMPLIAKELDCYKNNLEKIKNDLDNLKKDYLEFVKYSKTKLEIKVDDDI